MVDTFERRARADRGADRDALARRSIARRSRSAARWKRDARPPSRRGRAGASHRRDEGRIQRGRRRRPGAVAPRVAGRLEWRSGRRRLSRWRRRRAPRFVPPPSPVAVVRLQPRLDAARLRQARLGQRRRGQRLVSRRRDRVQHPARRGPVRPAHRVGASRRPAEPVGRAETQLVVHYHRPPAARARRERRTRRRTSCISDILRRPDRARRSAAPSASCGSPPGCSDRCAPCSPTCSTSSRSAGSSRARSSTSRSRSSRRSCIVGERVDQRLRAHRDEGQPRRRSSSARHPRGRDGAGEYAWGTRLVGFGADRRDVLRALQVPPDPAGAHADGAGSRRSSPASCSSWRKVAFNVYIDSVRPGIAVHGDASPRS